MFKNNFEELIHIIENFYPLNDLNKSYHLIEEKTNKVIINQDDYNKIIDEFINKKLDTMRIQINIIDKKKSYSYEKISEITLNLVGNKSPFTYSNEKKTEVIINFVYYQQIIKIQCKRNEYMRDIFKRYLIKIQKDINNIFFLYNGDKIKEDLKLEEINDKDTEIEILVNDINIENDKNDENDKIFKQNTDILCPKCREICLLNINDYKITLNKCKYGHNILNILLDEFENLENNNTSEVSCYICHKREAYNNQFYLCCDCKIDLCPLCKLTHKKEHKLIDYKMKNYLCNIHGERYIFYCEECNKNLCDLCEIEHNKSHNLNSINKYLKYKEYNIDSLRIKIDKFKNELKDIINNLNKVIQNIEIYFNIYNNIFKNYNKRNKSYQILMNLNNMNDYSEKIIKNIDEIINENKIENKIKYIYEIYDKMIIKNEIMMIYDIGKEDNVKIFGEKFIENNKTNYQMMIDDKNFELDSFYKVTNKKENQILKVRLRQIKNINDLSFMFDKCSALVSLINIENLDTINIISMNSLFNGCTSLTSLPNFSNWNISNLKDIGYMFNECNNLLSLPDISKWNTNNITNMTNVFKSCSSLTSLPDISKWDISNVIDISFMFNNCSNLLSLPDISKWNTINVRTLHAMLEYCTKLTSLPDISKWNTSNVIDIGFMFNKCNNLLSLPNISKWNTKNITNMSSVFQLCTSLTSLPDISNWDTSKVIDISYMFYGCSSLISLPEISKWNINNVINYENIYSKCSKLSKIPNIFNK